MLSQISYSSILELNILCIEIMQHSSISGMKINCLHWCDAIKDW